MRTIDLEAHEYRVKGPAPEPNKCEPFWGPGAPDAIGYLSAWCWLWRYCICSRTDVQPSPLFDFLP
jgi:hypothetical protein